MKDTSAILEGLNAEQKKAVCCTEGPVLIIAGAGAGKTKVLTSRVAKIIENGVPPSEIMALTFTRKAATEMKERIAVMVGNRLAARICMGTFHSVFIRFLREFSETLGYPENFTIYDTSDSQSAIKTCLKELNLDEKVYKPKEVLSRISMAKNNLVTPAAYAANAAAIENDRKAKKPYICQIYSLYWQKCRKSGVMDFDDILFNMNILLKESEEARNSISERFSHVLVDEYQDTNHAQYMILRQLCSSHRNLCVVGDDSQSIYAFRGARIENILNFRRDYPECNVFRLEQNYRSTRTIVDAANSLISRNSSRIPKKCFSEGDKGEKIRLINSFSEIEEAYQVASSIVSRMQRDKAEYQDFAILYRTNAQSRALEEQLRKRNLPYMVYSGNSFFDRAEVKDVLAYLKLASNINDDESFRRIVNKPARGIGDTSMAALAAAAHAEGCSLFKAAWLETLTEFNMKPAAVSKVRAFCDMMAGFASSMRNTDAYELARKIADVSGIWMMYKSDMSIEGQSRTANVEELLNSVEIFVEEENNRQTEAIQLEKDVVEVSREDLPVVTLDQYLENISLLSAVDVESDEESNNRIALMTVHSSKGLEFPHVYVVGMEENIFPSGGTGAGANEVEEERRLFYVALTRACRTVTLSFASSRMRNGKSENNYPSRFIREIDREYILNPLESGIADDDFGDRFTRDNPFMKYDRPGTSGSYAPARRTAAAESHAPVRRTAAAESHAQTRKAAVERPAVRRTSTVVPERSYDEEFVPSPILELREGQSVEHNRFGFGRIQQIITDQGDRKARILFDEYGEKLLILKYAKIRIVSGK